MTASGTLCLQNGSVVSSFTVDKLSLSQRFQGLTSGTKYIVAVHTYRHGEFTELGREWTFTQPEMEPYLGSRSAGDNILSSTSFRCKFHSSPDVIYSVRWYVQRPERNFTIEKGGENIHGFQELSLTEEDLLKHHITLPFRVSCAIAENPGTTQKTSFSVSSDRMFAGIKLLTPEITMHRDETAVIRFRPTVPFGCYTTRKMTDVCNLTMAVSIPVSKKCTEIKTGMEIEKVLSID
ncbi:uncharacterized protein LOC128548586 [Mercenaria mercenaria]|uniref:uncharacterized protein LOC128548586 n=1 Tax=Mercenaria mercenaria TaxID=6596 RepID=UPI00234F837B|nr:uncharacterized protein LOC128548586 [Mercenaria mercenaria]